MSMEASSHKIGSSPRASWSSTAFIVESILLLMFLIASLAVLTQTFASALSTSAESRMRDAATIAAGSIAERFSADPTGIDERIMMGDLLVTCEVSEEPRNDGVLHHAMISVYSTAEPQDSAPIYTLKSARYESRAS